MIYSFTFLTTNVSTILSYLIVDPILDHLPKLQTFEAVVNKSTRSSKLWSFKIELSAFIFPQIYGCLFDKLKPNTLYIESTNSALQEFITYQ